MAGVGNGGGGGGGAIRAGRAFVELYAEDNKVYRALDRLKSRFQSFAGLSIKAGVALGAGGAAALAPLKGAMDTITEQGKLGAVADAFGLSAEEASRLFGIMQSGGSDLRDATEGLVTLGQRVTDALAGNGKEAVELFDNLGVSAAEFKGLNPAQQFYKLVESLQAVSDPAQRVQLLLKAVGEDTGKNLIPVLSMSADQLRDLGDAFQQSSADVAQARATSLQYTLATARLSAVWRDVAAALAPALAELLGWLQRALGPFAAWVKQNRAAAVTAVQVAAGITAAGVALVAFGLAIKIAAVGLGGFVLVVKGIGAAVALVLSPLGLLAGAIGGLGYLVVTQTDSGKSALGTFASAFEVTANTAKAAWGGIVAAVQKGDLELAFKIATTGIQKIWKTLLYALVKSWQEFGREIIDSPLGRFNDFMVRNTGVGVLTSDITKVMDAIAEKRKLNLNREIDGLQKELEDLIAKANAPAAAGANGAANLAPGQRAAVRVGAQGSFSAAMAAQRFSLFDDIPLQQLKEQKKANQELNAINVGVNALAGALSFK